MGELSGALSVPLSTATRMVDWLVSSGYAQRLPDVEDRRVVRVALTDSGRELHRTIESYTSERVQQILFCLTPEEQATLFALIRKVVAALKGIA
jgi:DNA-binding MarR family transcriptional regulator